MYSLGVERSNTAETGIEIRQHCLQFDRSPLGSMSDLVGRKCHPYLNRLGWLLACSYVQHQILPFPQFAREPGLLAASRCVRESARHSERAKAGLETKPSHCREPSITWLSAGAGAPFRSQPPPRSLIGCSEIRRFRCSLECRRWSSTRPRTSLIGPSMAPDSPNRPMLDKSDQGS